MIESVRVVLLLLPHLIVFTKKLIFVEAVLYYCAISKEVMSESDFSFTSEEEDNSETIESDAKLISKKIKMLKNFQPETKRSVGRPKKSASSTSKLDSGEKNIDVYSTCEHHFLPITGEAHIAYIPKDKVIGLSKINRLVDYYAHRPQVQERLSLQILKDLQNVLETDDVIVMISAKHLCVSSRGIKDKNSFTTTLEYGGCFSEKKYRKKTKNVFFQSVLARILNLHFTNTCSVPFTCKFLCNQRPISVKEFAFFCKPKFT